MDSNKNRVSDIGPLYEFTAQKYSDAILLS